MTTTARLNMIYPACRTAVGERSWRQLIGSPAGERPPGEFPSLLDRHGSQQGAPAYLADLARLEYAIHRLNEETGCPPPEAETPTVNPSLILLELSWRGLLDLATRKKTAGEPEPGQELILLWKRPGSGKTTFEIASAENLLALKVIAENRAVPALAREYAISVSQLEDILWQARQNGVLLPLRSRLRRPADFCPPGDDLPMNAAVFTLQWHITQQCDLHCRHCYDRSQRSPLDPARGLGILDELQAFCRERNVRGQVSFTGGNPFLHPHFRELYREAAARGLMTAILGNPVRREELEEIIAIQQPRFFQVSLEGLAEHNDAIRGRGHFNRVTAFLEMLRELNIYSMVMLTLTEANLSQVIPLAEQLEGRAELFTFNRLSLVGEGAGLRPAPVGTYPDFLRQFSAATRRLRCLGLKDNFLNLIRPEQNLPLFGGCTGFGCGAAFNFLAVLPDGEVHACRKFPSPLGNLVSSSLAAIYDSNRAEQYRQGPSSCIGCRIRAVCRGCLAVIQSFGLDPSRDRDPYCFTE